MSNELTFLFRVIFDAWEQTFDNEVTKYPPYSFDVYLTVPLGIIYEGEDSKDYDPDKNIRDYFGKAWKESRKKDFDGYIENVSEVSRIIFLEAPKAE